MKELYEFRIPDELAAKYLSRDVGDLLGTVFYVRKVVVSRSDPLFETIREAQHAQRAQGSFFVTSIIVRRKYSKRELNSAVLLTPNIGSLFEPAGEECGTIYDDSDACTLCSAPRRQMTDLFLDLSKFPKARSAAVTIARNEVVFTDSLVQLIRDAGLTGIEFRPVHQHRPSRKPLPPFWQPRITAPKVSAAPQTKFGYSDLEDELAKAFRCPRGPVAGLNRLSELFITRATWEGSDFAETTQYIGTRRGLLNPFPMIVVSQRARRVMEQHPKKLSFEVVHLV